MKHCLLTLGFLYGIFTWACCQAEEIEEVIEEEIEPVENHFQPLLLKPVVQFSCARFPTPEEDAWEKALKGKDQHKKLNALGNLLGLSAPSSVPLQYQTYLELKEKFPDHYVIKSATKAFNPKRIKTVIAKTPSKEKYGRPDNQYAWCIRAVGVLNMKDSIPRLLELSKAENLGTYLAAERSIEDFKGEVAEDALMKVISFWKYNAYIHASDEMMKRNPKRFAKELEKMNPPEDCKYQYGLYLAYCKNPKAVPVLCETVGKIHIKDFSMFRFIASLGQPHHKDIILDLPNNVREDQKEKAKECIKKYLERMKKSEN